MVPPAGKNLIVALCSAKLLRRDIPFLKAWTLASEDGFTRFKAA
jgi:hypothetical protein